MPVVDRISNLVNKVIPQKESGMAVPLSTASGGIGHGAASFDDELPFSKASVVYHTLQIFFFFLAMCCFAGVAKFQAKWHIGPSGLSGFAIFAAVTSLLLSAFLLLVPVIYHKTGKVARLARALYEIRVMFILLGTGVIWALLISFVTTISAWTQPGCKNADHDPHADLGDAFKEALPGWCRTKKAGAVFFWMAFAAWIASLVLGVMEWRSGKQNRPRDPPFSHPADPSEDDAFSVHTSYGPVGSGNAPRRATQDLEHQDGYEYEGPFGDHAQYDDDPTPSLPPGAGRPSIDAYGAFQDPAPSGYGAPPVAPPPGMSRTMAYADPYAALRASIQKTPSPTGDRPSSALPPNYLYPDHR